MVITYLFVVRIFKRLFTMINVAWQLQEKGFGDQQLQMIFSLQFTYSMFTQLQSVADLCVYIYKLCVVKYGLQFFYVYMLKCVPDWWHQTLFNLCFNKGLRLDTPPLLSLPYGQGQLSLNPSRAECSRP